MIHTTHRFHGRSSLRFVYQRGQTIRGPIVSLRFVRNERRRTYRAAVVVSRKVSKHAVVRNRIRRRLYEIVRKQSGRIVGPYDIVLSVYSEEASTMAHADLQKLVLDQLARARIVAAASASGAEHAIVNEKETHK